MTSITTTLLNIQKKRTKNKRRITMNIVLTEKEKVVCKVLFCALHNKNGICDSTDFSQEDEEILSNFQKKGFLKNDVNCIVLSKEFKEFLYDMFGGEK